MSNAVSSAKDVPGRDEQDVSQPVVSIVVINKNEAEVEATLVQLAEIRRQSSIGVELVVVDASEQKFDHLNCADIASWEDFTPIPGRVTIPHQRNRGIALARGRIVVFVDAGCEMQDEWLEELVKPILHEGEKIVTGVWVDSPHLRADEELSPAEARTYVKSCPTLTVAISRAVFDLIGNFDETFAYGSDLDFCLRAGAAGVLILRNPAARVRAHWGGGTRRAKRSYVYGKARTRLLRKHRRAYIDAVGLPIRAVVYPLYLLTIPLWFRLRWLPLLGLAAFIRSAATTKEVEVEGYKYCEAAGSLVEVVLPTNRRKQLLAPGEPLSSRGRRRFVGRSS